MQNKGMVDIVANKDQEKPDAKCSFYLDSTLEKNV